MAIDILNQFILLQRQMDRHERYMTERDISHGVTKLDGKTSSLKETVEQVLLERQLKAALWYALSHLSPPEFDIVEEYFFLREPSETLEILGARHGISRQAYSARLKRILKKLCVLMQEHSPEVLDLYNSLIYSKEL